MASRIDTIWGYQIPAEMKNIRADGTGDTVVISKGNHINGIEARY